MPLAIFFIINTLEDPYNLIWEPLLAGICTKMLSGNSNLAQLLGLLLILRELQQAVVIEPRKVFYSFLCPSLSGLGCI